jgi:hypothetical protein
MVKYKGFNREFTYMRCPLFILIVMVVFICMTIIVPVIAEDSAGSTTSTTHVRTWQNPARRFWEQKHRVFFSADEFIADGDRAKQGGDYYEALGSYNTAIDTIQKNGILSDTEKNRKLAEIYRHKADLYRVRQDVGDDALAARADEKAQSYVSQGTGHDFCPVYLTYYLTPLAGTVEQVKDFRDGQIKKSYTGSRFMEGFNAWYYSLSPSASGYIGEHALVKTLLAFDLAPLMGIVIVSQGIFILTGFNAEVATICTLIAGGALYGIFYIFPYASLGMIFAAGRGWRIPTTGCMKPAAIFWMFILAALCAGVIFSLDLLTVISSGLIVICSMLVSAGVSSIVYCRFMLGNPARDSIPTSYHMKIRGPEQASE